MKLFFLLLFVPMLVFSQVNPIKKYDFSELNKDLVLGRLTADIAFHFTTETQIDWKKQKNEIYKLKEIFRKAGIQLKVVQARLIKVPSEWQTVAPRKVVESSTPWMIDKLLYRFIEDTAGPMPESIIQSFSGMIGTQNNESNTVHFLALKSIYGEFYDQNDAGEWKIKKYKVAGLSFPSYSNLGHMPRQIRGAMALSPNSRSGVLSARFMGHELGHKLINVSHEGVGVCPKNEVSGGDDLMVYGDGTRIPRGLKGRYQTKRLQLSPFVYREDLNNNKVYNPDYKDLGKYRDPIYLNTFYFEEECPELPELKIKPASVPGRIQAENFSNDGQ